MAGPLTACAGGQTRRCALGCPHLSPSGPIVWGPARARVAAHRVRVGAEPSTASRGAEGSAGGASAAGKTVLVLGGCGRVGASTAQSLLQAEDGVKVVLAGRSRASQQAAVQLRPSLGPCDFVQCDATDERSLLAAISNCDVVVHCAGPFQRSRDPTSVLRACIAAGRAYVDVCDDASTAMACKALHKEAKAKGVPCVTTAGIYPGVSNIMAAEMLASARVGSDGTPVATARAKRLLFSYFTAGTGGAGPTILDTSLLLAGEDVTVFLDGEEKTLPPVSSPRVVDFGPGVGRKTVYLYNLPEVISCHRNLGVPSLSARFGTAPEVWNWGMVLAARLLPRNVLQSPDAVRGLTKVLGPLVRALDPIAGEQVAMRVDVEFEDGKAAVGLWVHDKLSESVGACTAAVALEVARGQTEPGVWFPEEAGAVRPDRRRAVLREAAKGCKRVLLNKAPWMVEQDPQWLGMGIYW